MHWWIADLYSDGRIVQLVSWIFWVILSICLHELAHGWAALWQGDDTPRRLGHMTLNPMVHMGPWSLLMFALTGIAWGMMPVDPSRFRMRRKGRFFVSGAGPAMNLLIAVVALTATALWEHFAPANEPLQTNTAQFLFTGGWINIFLAVFNLLPIPPLDGADVLSGLFFRAYVFFQKPEVQTFGIFILIALLWSGFGGSFLFGAAKIGAHRYVSFLVHALGGYGAEIGHLGLS